MTIAEIFAAHGEPYFRAGEARVIARLLDHGPQVLATGGGAIMDQRTRDLIHIKGVSVWLKADIDVLLKRTKRRGERPLVDKMKELLPPREPVYALADITVQSRDEPHETIVDEIVAALPRQLSLAGIAASEEKELCPRRTVRANSHWSRSRSPNARMTSRSDAAPSACWPTASRRCGRARGPSS